MTNNQLAENSVNQLLNSVRLARDNAERDDNRVDHSFYYALTIALEELQERRKADSEPVGEFYEDGPLNWYQISDGDRVPAHRRIPLYRHPQPAPERDQVRKEHAEWSQATFGNIGPVGPLKHLSKEALEAAAEPGDLSEWADMQFLLWDAQRRAGITDEQITQAMIEKLAVNKQREWPEPKDGEPRLHIKAQPAPVVPAVSDDIGEIRVGRLPAMNQDDYPGLGDWWVQLRIGEDSDEVLARVYGATPQEANSRAEALACSAAMLQVEPVTTANKLGNSPEQRWSRCCTKGAPALDSPSKNAESRCGNSPAIPDGYVMVPKEPTRDILDEFDSIIDYGAEDSEDAWRRLLAAAPQEVGDA